MLTINVNHFREIPKMIKRTIYEILIVVLVLVNSSEECIGSGCVHHRERDQFFWCSGLAKDELNSIRSWFGDHSRFAMEGYCTSISAMHVTRDPVLRQIAESVCGRGHQVICHEDISGRFFGNWKKMSYQVNKQSDIHPRFYCHILIE